MIRTLRHVVGSILVGIGDAILPPDEAAHSAIRANAPPGRRRVPHPRRR